MEAVYFDTSALRALGMAVLRRLPPGATYQTSVLALMELASGLRRNPREYQRRRALLCGLAEIRFPMVSRGPEQMLRAAFRVLPPLPEDNRLLSIGRLTALVREAPELAEFETSIRTLDLVPLVESFEIYDRTVGEHYVQHSVDGHRVLREKYARYQRGDERLFPSHGIPREADLREYLQRTGSLSVGLSFRAVVERLAEEAGDSSVEFRLKLGGSYDGSLDIFFQVWSRLDDERAGSGSQPAHNEMIDLGHFMYLCPGTVLVSEDRRMLDNARAVGCAAWTSDDLRRTIRED